jgi:hypothetical protein
LLAKHGLKAPVHLYFRIFTLPETFNSDPVLGTPITSIFFPHKGKIIFHGTGSHTGLTSRAKIPVNDHAPFALCLFSQSALRAHTI